MSLLEKQITILELGLNAWVLIVLTRMVFEQVRELFNSAKP